MLVYGDLGKYGKEISLDGCDYINFHIPQGTYLVRNNSEWCTLYITKNEYFRNADGYMENEIIQTIVFDNKNQTSTITITEGQQIEITINGNLTLIPQN
ncbi:MAG: hypothetical protein IKU42_04690 [Oscillospiraceae bacterium]|nr:hypothetical protein [Oscillospiraceae bacterium]